MFEILFGSILPEPVTGMSFNEVVNAFYAVDGDPIEDIEVVFEEETIE